MMMKFPDNFFVSDMQIKINKVDLHLSFFGACVLRVCFECTFECNRFLEQTKAKVERLINFSILFSAAKSPTLDFRNVFNSSL
jgi:hypothetical protein